MKILKYLRRNAFVPLLALAVCIADPLLAYHNPVIGSDWFAQNDYELIQRDHPEKTWDKVFFGNSIVTSAFIEEESASGYLNCGVDYGTVRDLYEALTKGYMQVSDGGEIVLGLNFLTFMDELDTNKTYIWHKEWYEPYFYFERDRFGPLLTNGVTNLLHGEPFAMRKEEQQRALYYGVKTDAELDETEQKSIERFGMLTLSDFEENFEMLQKLIDWCGERDICLRALWMPWNPKIVQYEPAGAVKARADEIFAANGIESLDWLNALEPQYFYDIGHLNYEEGAPYFTAEIDPWLCGAEEDTNG